MHDQARAHSCIVLAEANVHASLHFLHEGHKRACCTCGVSTNASHQAIKVATVTSHAEYGELTDTQLLGLYCTHKYGQHERTVLPHPSPRSEQTALLFSGFQSRYQFLIQPCSSIPLCTMLVLSHERRSASMPSCGLDRLRKARSNST